MNACPKCGAELQAGAPVCKNCGAETTAPGDGAVTRAAGTPVGTALQPEGADPVLIEFQRLVASFYKVERLLGRGRMTAVYKAEEFNPPRPVALKLLPPELGLGPAAARFKDEARKAMALNHPNIVPIYRVGLKGGAPYFIAMKLVEGRSLDAVIEAQGALPLPAILVALRVAAEALNHAQGSGTTHGRLNAANILVDGNGHVMVSDFGIAHVLEDATPAAAGKSGAPSQEQRAGGPADQRGDQHALGVVALQMLTGSLLPLADPLVSSPNIRSARERLPDELVQVVQTMLAQDPAQRYASAADMLAAIKAIPLSDTDRREGYAVLGRLARGEPVPKVPAPAPPRRFEARTVVRPAAPKAPSAAAPAVPAASAAPAAALVEVVAAAKSAPAAPAPPRVSAAAPTPAAPAVPAAEVVPARPALPATPSEHVVLAAPAEPAPRRRSRAVWVLAALLVTAGLAVAAYWALGRRPATSSLAQAPVASPAPSEPPAVPVVAESSRADTAHRAASDSARSDAALAPKTGQLFLSADPASAVILLDGTESGNEGGYVDSAVTAGRRHLKISAPGYVTLDTFITVRAGGSVDLGRVSLRASAAEAQAAPATARLRLRTVPATAEILVDGQSVGVGSLVDFEVAAGQRQLRISAPGYVTFDTLITVNPGATMRLGQVSLKSAAGGP